MKIGIISGSIRQNRAAVSVAQWVATGAERIEHPGIEFEVVDLADFNLPLYAEAAPPMMLNRQYSTAEQTAWSEKINELDGFIFVTAEYNHGIPGAFKNAVDTLAPEWMDKPVAVVSYGADGGIRATEQWRTVLANFNMYVIRATVALGLFTDFDPSFAFAPLERREAELDAFFGSFVETMSRQGALV